MCHTLVEATYLQSTSRLSKENVRAVCNSLNISNDWQMADCHSGLQPVQGLGLLIPELVLKLLKDLTHLMVSWPGACAGHDEVIHAQLADFLRIILKYT